MLIPSHLDYYRGFNNSIGTFGGVLQYINGIKRIAESNINFGS